MDTLHAIVLGIIQGLTEFLPVSSSAHLVLFPYFFKWDDPGMAFDVALHMGTLAAILAFFWRDWIAMLKQLLGYVSPKFRDSKNDVSIWLIVIGTIPAAAIGLMLEKLAEDAFRAPWLIAITMAGFGALLWYFDVRGGKNRKPTTLTMTDAVLVGLAQSLAVIPGVSRSGITITAALALGLTRPAAARFSFLLSAPIIAGAGILKSKHIFHVLRAGGAEAIAVGWGFAASLIAGLLAVCLLSYIIKSRTFVAFSLYRIVLGIIVVVIVIIR